MLAYRDNCHPRCVEFADRAVYVTRYRDDELYADDLYNQPKS